MSKRMPLWSVILVVLVADLGACVSHPESGMYQPAGAKMGSGNAEALLRMGSSGLPLKSLLVEANRCGSEQLQLADSAFENVRLGGSVSVCDSKTISLALQRLGIPVIEIASSPPSPARPSKPESEDGAAQHHPAK